MVGHRLMRRRARNALSARTHRLLVGPFWRTMATLASTVARTQKSIKFQNERQ